VCQDSGVAVVFLEIGQDVHWVGGPLTDAVHAGIREGTQAGYLRKSVTGDPTRRVKMAGDFASGVVHLDIVPGAGVRLTVASKGFGAENMSAMRMLVPADGIQGITNVVVDTVERARQRVRWSSFGLAWRYVRGRALLAKKAAFRELTIRHPGLISPISNRPCSSE
jgi:fumarate hydratase subunit alpha